MIRLGPIVLIGLIGCTTLPPAPDRPAIIRAIDADTFELANGERLRIENYDAPETRISDPIDPRRGAQCAAEKSLGLQAKTVVQSLIDQGRLTPIPSEPPRYDGYGRRLGQAELDGADYAAKMTRLGWLQPYPYSTCARACKPDWCGELGRRRPGFDPVQ